MSSSPSQARPNKKAKPDPSIGAPKSSCPTTPREHTFPVEPDFPAFFAGRKQSAQSDPVQARIFYEEASRIFGGDPVENAEAHKANNASASSLYLRLLQTEEGRALLSLPSAPNWWPRPQ